jgi:hypothetical protein
MKRVDIFPAGEPGQWVTTIRTEPFPNRVANLSLMLTFQVFHRTPVSRRVASQNARCARESDQRRQLNAPSLTLKSIDARQCPNVLATKLRTRAASSEISYL